MVIDWIFDMIAKPYKWDEAQASKGRTWRAAKVADIGREKERESKKEEEVIVKGATTAERRRHD